MAVDLVPPLSGYNPGWCWWNWTGDPNQYGPYYFLLWLPLVGTLIATLVVLWRMRGSNDGKQ